VPYNQPDAGFLLLGNDRARSLNHTTDEFPTSPYHVRLLNTNTVSLWVNAPFFRPMTQWLQPLEKLRASANVTRPPSIRFAQLDTSHGRSSSSSVAERVPIVATLHGDNVAVRGVVRDDSRTPYCLQMGKAISRICLRFATGDEGVWTSGGAAAHVSRNHQADGDYADLALSTLLRRWSVSRQPPENRAAIKTVTGSLGIRLGV
jgi:hypothetical protein